MRLKLYLLLPLLFIATWAAGQTITYQDVYQTSPVTLTKSGSLYNGKVFFTGSGTDTFGTTYQYNIRWCTNYNNQGFDAWVMDSDQDHPTCQSGNAYYYSRVNTDLPPSVTDGVWKEVIGSQLQLSGSGLLGNPVVFTNVASNIGLYSATLNGTVVSNSGAPVIERGVVYALSPAQPTTADTKLTNGNGTGSFSVAANSLNLGTSYDARAYAISTYTDESNGQVYTLTGYGLTNTFTTLTPVITATAVSAIPAVTYGSASSPGSFTVAGANMLAGISVAAPAGFEVSLSAGSGYGSSVTVGAAGTISATTVYVRLAGGNNAGNYSGTINLTSTSAAAKTSAIGTSTVNQIPITVKGKTLIKGYGNTLDLSGNTAVYVSISAGSLPVGSNISEASVSSAGATSSANAGDYNLIIANGSIVILNSSSVDVTANYAITLANGTLTVSPAALTYTANTATRIYGAANPALTGTVTGFKLGQTLATATTGTLAFASTATTASNVGSYAINGSGLTANNGNYFFTQAAGNNTALTITAATLTYEANGASRAYGAANPVFSGTVTGFANGETQAVATTGTLAFSSMANASSSVGTYMVNGSGLTANNGNYTFVQAAANSTALTISPATLTYVANTASRVYGTVNPAFSGTLIGFANSETQATATTGTLAFTSAATQSSNVGSYAINGSGLTANNGNYIFAQNATNNTALTISPEVLTYVANTASRAYGVANPVFSGTITGFALGQTQATATTGTITFTSSATTTSNAGSYAINGSGLSANNGNYTFTQAGANNTALTVTPATLTYTANSGSKIYGAANPILSGTVTGFANGETLATATTGTLAFSTPATAASNVGAYLIMGNGLTANNGNYTFVQAAGNGTAFTINPATLTYTANTASRAYGASNPVFSGTITGFVNSETQAIATGGTLAFTSTATQGSSVGTYPISGSGLTANNGNYTFAQAAGNNTALTITAATLTYVANLASRNYGTTNPAFSGSVTGFANGETLATATSGSLAFVSSAATASNVGTYAITGSGLTANSGNYAFVQASGNSTALTINPVVLTYAANGASKIYGSSNPAFSGTVTGFANGETQVTATIGTLAFTSATSTNSNVGTYLIIGSGLTAKNGNYIFAQASGNHTAFVINPATLTYTANPASRLYGSPNPAFSGTVTGFVLGQDLISATSGTLAFASAANAVSPVGQYSINGSGLTANNGNYNFAQAAGNATALTIDPAPPVLAGTSVVNYTEKDPATTLNSAIAVSDADNSTLANAKVSININYVAGEDVLSLTSNPAIMGDIAGSFDPATGILSLNSTGGASLAQFQQALRTVKYFNLSSNPSAAQRVISFSVNDGVLNSNVVTSTVNITAVNDAPVLAGTSILNYTEKAPATVINGSIAISDVDNTTLANAKVSIGTNYVAGQDELSLANVPATMGDITGTFDPLTREITLSSATTASLSQFEAALRSVKYINHSSNPSVLPRTINFVVNDGVANSNVISSTINITAVNDAPVLAGTSVVNYTEKDPATVINAAVVVSDVDNANLGSATVAISANFATGEDVLSLTNNPATMGDIAGTFDPATGVLSLSSAGGASLAQFQEALRAVKYANTSFHPSILPRTVSFKVSDGALASNVIVSTINVASVNDAPTVANAIPMQNVVEDSPFSFTFASNTFQDIEGDVLTYTARLAGGAALPSWLSFNAVNRTLSGTPNHAAVGTLAVEIVANDGNGGTIAAPFSIVVAPIPLANITYVTPQNLSINVAITPIVPTNTGGLATYSISPALPSGLNLDPVSGIISGTPTVVSSSASYQVSATNASGTTHFNLTIHVIGSQAITFAALANQTYGDVPFDLTATGGASGNPITYTSSDTNVATVNGDRVTLIGAGTTVITANQTGNADYTAAPAVQQSLTVNKKDQTISFAALPNKTYGDAPFDLTATGGGSGAIVYVSSNTNVATINGDKVTIVGAGVATITASQAGNANFNPAIDVSQQLTVINQDQTISFAALPTKTYGDVPFNLTATGGTSGNPIVYTSSNTNVATINGNVVTIVGAGSTQLTATQLGNANYNAAVPVVQTLTVDKALAVLSLGNLTQGYNGSAKNATVNVVPTGVTGISISYDGSATAPSNSGTYAVLATLSNANYTAVDATGNLVINPLAIAVTAVAKNKTYGDADPALDYTFSPALVTGDNFTGSLSRTTGENVGSYAINQNNLALNGNYTLNYTGADLAIGKKTIDVLATAKGKTYGDADPALSYTFSPALVGGDNFTGSLSRTAGENVGSYAINQNSLALNSNYTLNYTGADLTIGKKTINVLATAKNKTYGDADPALSYTFSPALVIGDGFTGSLSRTAGENVGTYAINQNSLALNGNYTLNYTGADLTIGKKTIDVLVTAKNKTYGDADPVLSYTFSPALVTGDGFTGSLSRTAGENVGTYAINQNSLALNGNYILNYTGADLTIGKKTIDVLATAKSKTYGDADPALSYTFSPALVTGDGFTGSLSRAIGENVGTYAINQNSLALNGNYTLNYTGAHLTIGKKTINVLAAAKNKTYGDADPALTYTFSPALVTGDNFTGSLSRTAGENVGTYAINQNSLALSNNYTLNYAGANLTIAKKALVITADNKTKLFNQVNPTLTASYSGFVGTENASALSTPVTLSTTATLSSPAGTYPITASGAAAQNYSIAYVQGTLTINGTSQTITFASLPDKLSTDAPFQLTATASSGLAVSYSSSDVSIARIINGNQVEILKAGTVNITANQAGNANYLAASPVIQSLKIADNPAPVIAIVSNLGNSLSKGETALLTATGAVSYQWATANGIVAGQNTAVLTVRPSQTTTYTVTGSNIYGRSSTQSITIEVKDDFKTLNASNIVTPNGDGINDYWVIDNIDLYPNNSVTIFDRAGKTIFKVKGYKNDWNATLNGAPLAEGTYYYIVDFGAGIGTKKGFITILR